MRFCNSIILIALFLSACKDNNNAKIEFLVKEWTGKTIRLPQIKPIILYTGVRQNSLFIQFF
jgi:hypothetical protein